MPATAPRSLATHCQPRNLFVLACGLVPLGIVFALNWNFVLARFFKEGAYLSDIGIVGALIYKPTLALEMPVASAGAVPRLFYADHVTPMLWLIGLPSWVLPVNYIYYSAAVFAAVATGPSAALAFVLWRLFRRGSLKGATALIASVMVAAPLALAFSGSVLRAANYPHYELLFIPFATLFFVFAAQRRLFAAGIAFAICVLTREDFALHLLAFIFVWIVFEAWVERASPNEVRYWLKWMAASGIAGATIILTQRLFLHGGGLIFRVYLGWPPFEHVDLDLIAARIHVLVTGRLDLFVCLASAATLAIWQRDARYVLGHLACMPWLVFNLLARTQAAGTLNLYYGFPFVLAMIWPVLVLLLSDESSPSAPPAESAPRSAPRRALAVATVSMAGFIGSTVAYAQWADFGGTLADMRPVPRQLRAAGLTFQRLLADGLLDRERIGTDDAVASLLPRVVRREQIVTARNLRDFRAVAFYATSLSAESKIGLLIDAGYTRAAEVGASSLYIAAKPSADTEQMLQRLSKDGLQLSDRPYLMARMRAGEVGVRRDTSIAAVGDADGLIAFGPYVRLPAGSYRALFTIIAEGCAQTSDGHLELTANGGFDNLPLARRSVAARDVFSPARACAATIDLDFTLDQRQAAGPVETPVRRFGGGRYTLTDIQIVRVDRGGGT
jgi:hypothetical protein